MQDTIRVCDVEKYYGSRNHMTKAVDRVSFTVESGEFIGVMGASGSGKTTLLNLILGLVEADAGTIEYNGEDITALPMEKRGFNIVFQDYALFPNLNG